ncbi:hypothetical protein F183_A51150 [Bryobacterales bacterium F-183]|nr:hypothetical protein F183_A51150 [Bryobacterales bacterium F-183]
MPTTCFRGGLVALLFLAADLATFAQAASTKRPISHNDYDGWRTISSQTLSRDGKWLAYGFMPQDGDGDLIVREIATGKEYKVPAGALPPPPLPNPDANPDEEPPRRSLIIRFTSDNQYLVSSTFPTKAEVKAKGKGGLAIVKLSDGAVTRVPNVKNFQIPSKGGAWVAFHKEGATPATPSRRNVDEPGTDLILRNLATGESSDKTYANVTEYTFARDGKTLAFAVGNPKADAENGVFTVTPGDAAAAKPLLSGKGKYSKLTWDRAQAQLAFVTSKDAPAEKKYAVYLWVRNAAEAKPVVAHQVAGMPAGMGIVERGNLGFSRDGRKLYVAVGKPTAEPAKPAAPGDADEKVTMDLWHWHDDLVQPMQRVRAAAERARTYRGILDLGTAKYTQVADEALTDVFPSDDGTLAIGADTRNYRRMIDYDGTYADYYAVDVATGARKVIASKVRGGFGFGGSIMQWAPDGKHALYFSKNNWHIVSLKDLSTRNLTEKLDVSFADEEDDTPDPATSYGGAGWTRDSASAIVYDRYDVWQIFADPAMPAKTLTAGRGRREKIQFRVQRLDPVDEDDDQRGIDIAKPLTFRAVSEETRATGFFRQSKTNTLDRLIWGDKSYGVAGRAMEADVVLITASRFNEFPDLHVTNAAFAAPKKATNGSAQLANLRWGTAELVKFRNTDGVPLQSVLYKPENFDPTRQYPMIVYIYERLTQNLHSFVNPTPGTSINIAYYVSNGYLVLTPDIVYTKGYPGQSALKCVLPAIDAVVDKGIVRQNAIGIQGHSWGGYQIAYMVTQTNRFKAAEAGAPVGNMTSAYSGIRWGSGMPRQFQYEQTQSRIGQTLYANPQKFLENSPIFHIDRVRTPLLILHNDQDDAVPWYQGIELYLALRRNEKEAYLMNYNGEYHGLRRRHNQKDWTVRMQQFFDHHLRDAMKPEWMEKGVPFTEREEEKTRFQSPQQQ